MTGAIIMAVSTDVSGGTSEETSLEIRATVTKTVRAAKKQKPAARSHNVQR